MKIVLVHGQNHQGSSCQIGRMLAQKLAPQDHWTEFFLPRDLNHFCTGGCRCIEQDENCPFYPEKKRIMDEVEQADLLIFTTPTYCMHASAPMKAFLDLTFTNWMIHRPRASMFRKKAVVIYTAAGVGTKSAIRDVKTALTYWGVPEIRTYGVAVQAMGWENVSEKKKEIIRRRIEKLAEKLLGEKSVHVGIKTRALFWMMGRMQAAGMGSSPVERKYWQDQDWLGKRRPWKT